MNVSPPDVWVFSRHVNGFLGWKILIVFGVLPVTPSVARLMLMNERLPSRTSTSGRGEPIITPQTPNME